MLKYQSTLRTTLFAAASQIVLIFFLSQYFSVILIGYLFVTSLVGLYTIPIITRIRPMLNSTPLTHLILNCCIYVILSTALPLLAKILGITNFDLLGKFSEVKWLGNFYLVLLYNAIFAAAASLCLFNKFTDRVRQEIVKRVHIYISTIFSNTNKNSFSSNNPSRNVSSTGESMFWFKFYH